MTIFAAILLSLLILILGIKEYYQIKLKHKPYAPPTKVLKQINDYCANHYKNGGTLLIIGSGWGGFVYGLGWRQPNFQIVGIEPNPVFWLFSQLRSFLNKSTNVRLYYRNFNDWKGIEGSPDIIFADLHPHNLKIIKKKISKALETKRTVFLYDNIIDDFVPTEKIAISKSKNLYRLDKKSL